VSVGSGPCDRVTRSWAAQFQRARTADQDSASTRSRRSVSPRMQSRRSGRAKRHYAWPWRNSASTTRLCRSVWEARKMSVPLSQLGAIDPRINQRSHARLALLVWAPVAAILPHQFESFPVLAELARAGPFLGGTKRKGCERFSWRWRERSPNKIMERTYEEATEALRAGRGGRDPEAARGKSTSLTCIPSLVRARGFRNTSQRAGVESGSQIPLP
jgi:hypothetical protein